MKQPIIKGRNITLRVLTLNDAKAHHDCEDSEIANYLGKGKSSTLDGVRNWISTTVIPNWENNGPKFHFAIEENGTGVVVGHVEADIDNDADKFFQAGEANISYSLRSESRGKGYVDEAILLMASWIVENDIAQTALINVQQENAKSASIAHRLGFNLERTYKSEKSENIWLRYTMSFKSLVERGLSL